MRASRSATKAAPEITSKYASAQSPNNAAALGLTQEEVAARSGFSQQYLSSLERGRRNPTVITLYELAQALEASHVALVMLDDEI